ncbi:MAG: hypothetical protein M1472_05080 [Planctomycetes bacterium]|nr:hypothetical protein [Planctomycetota bacterium]
MDYVTGKSRGTRIRKFLAGVRRGYLPWLTQSLRRLRPEAVLSALREVRVNRRRYRPPERQGPRFEILEPRIMLSNVSWITPAGGDWGVGANWSTGTVPGSGDTAIVANLNPGAQVTYGTGSSTVAAVQASSPVEITGGTLTVTGSTQVTGTTLTLDGGTLTDTTLSTVSGGVIQTASSSTTTLDAATLDSNLTVTSGSTLDIADNLTLGSGATITVDAGGTLNFVDGTGNTQSVSGSGSIVLDAAGGSYAAGQINANGVNSGSSVTFGGGINITGEGTTALPNTITAAANNIIVFDNTFSNATITAAGGGGVLQVGGTGAGPTVFNGVSLDNNLTLDANAVLDVENSLNEAAGVAVTQGTGAQIDMLAGATGAQSALQPWVGDGMVTAQISGFTGTSSQLAGGVTFLDSNQPGAAFGAVTVSTGGVITFQWQAAANGPVSSTSINGSASNQWVRIVRFNNLVAGFYSSNDVQWTQIGTSQVVNFVNPSNLAGLTMSDTGGALTDAVMVGAQSITSVIPNAFLPPTVATGASASAGTVTGTTVNLTVAGQAHDGQTNSSLLYRWSLLGTPPAPVSFNANGTDAAANTMVTFTAAGTYGFQVTITDIEGVSVTSEVSVIVRQTPGSLVIAPSTASLNASQAPSSVQLLNAAALTENNTRQFTAVAYDQFGMAMATQPTITWSLSSGGGSMAAAGLYTAPDVSGTAVVQASVGGISATANITITSSSIAPAASSVTVQDPDFTDPSVGTGATAYVNMPSGEPWVGGGSAGVSANNTNFTSGNPDAPIGNQVAYLQDTGALSQNITFNTAGDYTLSLQAA